MHIIGLAIGLGFGAVGAGGEAPPSVPVNVTPPSVEFPAPLLIGSELIADTGTWTGAPTEFVWQWQRYTGGVWVNIIDRNEATYTVDTDDLGCKLRVYVFCYNGYSASANAYSNESEAEVAGVPVSTILPSVFTNGDWNPAIPGDVVQVDEGGWEPAPDEYLYQWMIGTDDTSDIEGATGNTYVVPPEAVGQGPISCRVSASNAVGSSEYVRSSNNFDIAVPQPQIMRFADFFPVTSFADGNYLVLMDSAFVRDCFWGSDADTTQPFGAPADSWIGVVVNTGMSPEEIAIAFGFEMQGCGFIVDNSTPGELIVTRGTNGAADPPNGNACATIEVIQPGVDDI